MSLTIAQAVKKLLVIEPFYGLFLMGLNKYFDDSIPTACVRKNGINIEIAINKDYWDSLDESLEVSVLLHEVLHILFKHLFMYDDFPNKDRFNISADCMVNSFVNKIGKDWYHPSQFDLGIGLGTKYYYENLPENVESTISNHDWKGFGILTDAEKQLINNQIDYQAKEVAEYITKTCGHIPGCLKEYIDTLIKNKKPVFNWKAYFRRIVGNSIKTYLKSTRYKPSYRFKNQPGIILKYKPKVMIAIDTSGSVSKQELQDFFSEVNNLYKSGIQIEIVEFDTRIQNKFVYKGRTTDIEIKGRGGTDMTEVYNLYTGTKEFSSLVIFTDGYLNTDFPRCKNMIWVISSDGDHKDYPGISVYIPKEM